MTTRFDSDKWLKQENIERVHRPIVAGRMLAEAGSFMLGTRLVPVVEHLAPKNYEKFKRRFAKAIIEPRLDWCERHILTLPAFSHARPAEEAAATPAEKAKIIASELIDFSASITGSMVGQGITQAVFNHFAGLPDLHDAGITGMKAHWQHTKNLGKPILIDKAVNVGLVGLLQVGIPKQTEKATEETANVLEKTLGVPPDKTRYFLQWYVPNLAGFGASSYLMTKKYRQVLTDLSAHSGAHATI